MFNLWKTRADREHDEWVEACELALAGKPQRTEKYKNLARSYDLVCKAAFFAQRI